MSKEQLIEKLQQERAELSAKIERLEVALTTKDDISHSQHYLLREQLGYMHSYRRVLVERICDLNRQGLQFKIGLGEPECKGLNEPECKAGTPIRSGRSR
jgi:uncharacterized protein (UPF0305 family)